MSGTQSKVHGKARVRPTLVRATGESYTPKSSTDTSWNPNLTVGTMNGDGQLAPIANPIEGADPEVSFSLEHDDVRGLRDAGFKVGDLIAINFTASVAGLEDFDVSCLRVTLVFGEEKLGSNVMMAFTLKCQDITIDDVSIVELAAE